VSITTVCSCNLQGQRVRLQAHQLKDEVSREEHGTDHFLWQSGLLVFSA
jgi:hypothetical protein